jgi:hypothetical protein
MPVRSPRCRVLLTGKNREVLGGAGRNAVRAPIRANPVADASDFV